MDEWLDTDPFSNPLCEPFIVILDNVCDDLFACLDTVCFHLVKEILPLYESTTIQRTVELNFVLVALLLTVFGVSYLIRELRYRN